MNAYKLSVIIPALNERDCLPDLLADLNAQKGVDLEIIIADGGSTDGTLERCRPFAPVIVNAPRGRARQLNAGFKKSRCNDLLFLHADSKIKGSYLLLNALRHWHKALEQDRSDRVAGHFPLKFIRTRHKNTISFRYTEGKTHFNRTNTTNGDQGFLLKRTFFKRLGRFDDSQHFLEDQKLAEKIRANGTWITLPGLLYTSGRRFEVEGYHRLLILMSMLMGLYSIGRMEFFQRASMIYTSQDKTGHLLLKPYFKACVKMFIHDLGFREGIRTWFLLGRYIRQNSWQMFYFFDILGRTSKKNKGYPLLNFHDRYFGPAIDNRFCDAAVALISFIWFMLILMPCFFIVDTIRSG